MFVKILHHWKNSDISYIIDLIFTTDIKTNILDPHHHHHNQPHHYDNQVPSCNRAHLLLVLLHWIHGSSKMVRIDNYFNLDYLINTCTSYQVRGDELCGPQHHVLLLCSQGHEVAFTTTVFDFVCFYIQYILLFISWAWFLCEGIDHQRQWPCWLHHCRFQIKTNT